MVLSNKKSFKEDIDLAPGTLIRNVILFFYIIHYFNELRDERFVIIC